MKKVLLSILLIITSVFSFTTPVFAANEGDSCTCSDGSTGKVTVNTAILSACDCGKGSVPEVLNLVVNILAIGIGILGVIGITIVGIQYLTAGGNEEKTRKAKRRMLEIVIGLVAYVLLYAALQWLLPSLS